jgi:hypothetical protein
MSTSSLAMGLLRNSITDKDKTDNVREVGLDGIMRAKVIKIDDPKAEGRIGCIIPRLMFKFDHSIQEVESMEYEVDSSKWDESSEIQVEETLDTVNYIWMRPSWFVFNGPQENNVGGSYRVPRIGTWVFVFFEDEDPQKGYYFPFGPTNDGEVINNEKNESPYIGDVEMNPQVDIIREYPNGTIIYTDFNEDRNEVVIKFRNNHVMRITDREDSNGIEFHTHNKNYIKIDDLNNDITVKANRDIKVDAGRDVSIKAGRNMQIESLKGFMSVASKSQINLQTSESSITLKSGKDLTVEVAAITSLKSTGAVSITSTTSEIRERAATEHKTMASKISHN